MDGDTGGKKKLGFPFSLELPSEECSASVVDQKLQSFDETESKCLI